MTAHHSTQIIQDCYRLLNDIEAFLALPFQEGFLDLNVYLNRQGVFEVLSAHLKHLYDQISGAIIQKFRPLMPERQTF